MRKALVAASLVLAAFAAHASFMGTLVSSEMATSVTGKMVWRCTYNVMGQNTTVVLANMCPISMQFD